MDSVLFFQYTLYFALYSFLGWMLEGLYRSVSLRKFVNAGFLFGPFLPIYGAGALLTLLLNHFLQDIPIFLRFFAFGAAVSILEYGFGVFSEKIFKLKLWDYSASRFNLHGRVCLLFSLLWTALALVFILGIHPAILWAFSHVPADTVRLAALAFWLYFITDATFSIISLAAFRKRVRYLYEEYFNLSNPEIENLLKSIQRLREAFPDLNAYINQNIHQTIKARVGSFLKPVQEKIIEALNGRKAFEKEYFDTVGDILGHGEFLKLKDYFHHNSSIYHHVHDVAYLSYRISKFLKLDYRSAARGALLHDFFLYDWRNHDVPDLPRDKFHGLEHPKIAAANAKKHFSINDMEEDIILKHMWPLTMMPPKYKESFVVSFVDKYLSSKEFIIEYKKRAKAGGAKIAGRRGPKHRLSPAPKPNFPKEIEYD